MKLVSKLYSYPLVAVHADKFVATRFALIGDAAVGMHPVTAHGFNLGLSGQKILAKEIKYALSHEQDIGGSNLLGKYQSKHMRTSRPLYVGTNEIVNFFTDDRIPVKILRHLALRVVNNLEPIKSIIKNKLTEADSDHPMLPKLF
jgi:2-polyprenyl-6-methoxyphenol hydroxylase-like FAD-dependent oxidoreductase